MPVAAAGGRLAWPVSGSVSAFDPRLLTCVCGLRERPATDAVHNPRAAHEHAHALAHPTATREPRSFRRFSHALPLS
jgi:hypothetical protein